jgi:hypothetical protein
MRRDSHHKSAMAQFVFKQQCELLMKIYMDKIESAPPHGIHVRDVRLVLKAVPSAWLNGLKEVRLSNSLEHFRPYAFFSRFDCCLTIYSRRGTKREVLIGMLFALAAEKLGINRGHRRRRSKAEKHQIDKLIQPYVETLLTALSPQPSQNKLSPEAHAPMHFAPFPNDVA